MVAMETCFEISEDERAEEEMEEMVSTGCRYYPVPPLGAEDFLTEEDADIPF